MLLSSRSSSGSAAASGRGLRLEPCVQLAQLVLRQHAHLRIGACGHFRAAARSDSRRRNSLKRRATGSSAHTPPTGRGSGSACDHFRVGQQGTHSSNRSTVVSRRRRMESSSVAVEPVDVGDGADDFLVAALGGVAQALARRVDQAMGQRVGQELEHLFGAAAAAACAAPARGCAGARAPPRRAGGGWWAPRRACAASARSAPLPRRSCPRLPRRLARFSMFSLTTDCRSSTVTGTRPRAGRPPGRCRAAPDVHHEDRPRLRARSACSPCCA